MDRNPFDGILRLGILLGVVLVLMVAGFAWLAWAAWQHLQWVP